MRYLLRPSQDPASPGRLPASSPSPAPRRSTTSASNPSPTPRPSPSNRRAATHPARLGPPQQHDDQYNRRWPSVPATLAAVVPPLGLPGWQHQSAVADQQPREGAFLQGVGAGVLGIVETDLPRRARHRHDGSSRTACRLIPSGAYLPRLLDLGDFGASQPQIHTAATSRPPSSSALDDRDRGMPIFDFRPALPASPHEGSRAAMRGCALGAGWGWMV
jgi:hypothetical protein